MGEDEKDKAHEEEERAFRLLLRQSWFSTSLERDKSILTVRSSQGGFFIGLWLQSRIVNQTNDF